MRALLAACLLLSAGAAQAERLTVVELFTSQGCSSCPPADALLARLARTDPGVLPLDMHVTYWNRLGWADPFSLPEATQRQRDFSARTRADMVYTPQMVVDGWQQAVGSDPDAVRQALATARARPRETIALSIGPRGDGMAVAVGAGAGRATLILVGFDAEHSTPVRRGENAGRTVTEVNVVRSLTPVGTWTGAPLQLALARPAGQRTAVLMQGEDGHIIGAAVAP